ncbi:MAG: CO dehydrogenase/acetyl-CoA synthase complex subunit alpha [Promethearchaeati archaeon SRVP18_Atabeyarchaeia-1]
MANKPARLKANEIQSSFGVIKGLDLSIGKIVMEEEAEWEPMGPTPFPAVETLRSWDQKLLARYKPFYTPICDMCCLCTMGKCDLTAGKKGACGINIGTQQARMSLMAGLMGCTAHLAHARHLTEHLIKKYGPSTPISLGTEIDVEAPNMRLVLGVKPKTLEDLEEGISYCEREVTQLLASTHTGQEGSNLDYESKLLHAGMLDMVGMEIADIAQISAYGFPKGASDAPLVDCGMGTIDATKPMILCVGHNVASGVEIADYLRANKLDEKVEVGAICCTALDLTRYYTRAKVVGPLSQQLRFIRSGIADVIMTDEQCVRTDIPEEAQTVKAPVIATNAKICYGFPDRTSDPVDQIVKDVVSGAQKGVLILDPYKAAEVAVKVVVSIAPKRAKFKALPDTSKIPEIAKSCTGCQSCRRACPNDLHTDEAVQLAKKGDLSKLADLYEYCIGCGKCEQACNKDIPVTSLITVAAERKVKEERFKLRSGRGPVRDTEIRNVGAPIVLGEIPGIVLFAGCSNYPNHLEVGEMAAEFLKRGFIVTATGCSAMDISRYKTEEGKSLYEEYPGDFDRGCLSNVGSCVSNAHVAGAAIKVASIFARRPLRGNYEELADYVLNRVGAVGIVWGTYSQKAVSIGTGANRLGVPVILGPHGSKYRRMMVGRADKDDDWYVYDARTGDRTYVGPVPEHLVYAAESKEEAMIMGVKLCLRANDTFKGRSVKLSHYVDLTRKLLGKDYPDDIHKFIRIESDIPLVYKEDLTKILQSKGWKPTTIPDPTLLKRLVRTSE